MKKKLLILSLLLITGCIGFNEEKKEPKKTEERVNIVNIVNIVKNRKNYTKKQLELKKYFDEYLVRLNSLDTEGVIDMTYPKLFIPINKTIFKQYINNVLTSDQISIESYDTNITDI
ncbi:MAG TPA: hypothetical protein ENK88_02260, partial [Campylobacterales bacterium]|nr:hypothetical protein [Campylobacterales bacterium]